MRCDTAFLMRVPAKLLEAIRQTADRLFTSRAAYIRQAIIEQLRRDGVEI